MTAAPTSALLPRPGDIVGGKYVLESLIGQGGMGAVFKAKHRGTGGVRAIKIMLADTSNPEALQRFKNEARAAAEIQNEHVVRVDDVDEEMGYAFMVLEYLEGEDLAQLVEREGRLPPHVAVNYTIQALQGIVQAHAMGIVHRDLKPSNLYLARRKDGSTTVKVLDFGISKASNASSALAQSPSALTSTKAMLGSPLYMSPEQLRSSKSVDQRADIWAIGIILYELLTRNVPFMGDNLGELFAAILETDPPRIIPLAPEVPPDLEAIVHRCLQRNRDHRFQTAQELTQALAPFAITGAGSPYSNVQMSGPLGGTAVLQSGHHPNSFVQTPGPNPRMTPPGSLTGSGPRVAGTVALGMTPGSGQQLPGGITPQPHVHAQTGNAWQSTGGGDVIVPKSKAPIIAIAAIFGVLVLAGGGLGIYSLKKGKSGDGTAASSSTGLVDPTATTPPTVASTATQPTTTAAATTPTPTTSATTSATPTSTAAVAVTSKPTGGHTGHIAATTTTKPQPPPPETTTAKPQPPPPTTATTVAKPNPTGQPTSTSGNLQNGR